jgi:hypothetical protein
MSVCIIDRKKDVMYFELTAVALNFQRIFVKSAPCPDQLNCMEKWRDFDRRMHFGIDRMQLRGFGDSGMTARNTVARLTRQGQSANAPTHPVKSDSLSCRRMRASQRPDRSRTSAARGDLYRSDGNTSPRVRTANVDRLRS